MTNRKKAGDPAEARARGIAALAAMGASGASEDDEPAGEQADDDSDDGGGSYTPLDGGESAEALAKRLQDELEGAGGEEDGEDDPTAALAAALSRDGYKDPESWRGDAKARLVAAGTPENVAHSIAYHGGAKTKVEALVRAATGAVDSGGQSAQQPSEGSAGAGDLSELLEGIEDGEAKEKLKPALQALQERLDRLEAGARETDTSGLVAQIRAAQQELVGTFPEIQDREEWGALQPVIKALASQGMTLAAALRTAAIARYGPRDGSRSNRQSDSVPAPNRAAGSGTSGMTPEILRKNIAQMVFAGATEKAVREYKARVAKVTGVTLD